MTPSPSESLSDVLTFCREKAKTILSQPLLKRDSYEKGYGSALNALVPRLEAVQESLLRSAPVSQEADLSEWEQRVWFCHRLLQDAVAFIDPEVHPNIVDRINEELKACDATGTCPAPKSYLPCEATSGEWHCTLQQHHDGDHIATTAREYDENDLIGDVAHRWAQGGAETQDRLPTTREMTGTGCESDPHRYEEVAVERVVSHWFIQGGHAEFGSIGQPQSVDEAVSAILSLVRTAKASSLSRGDHEIVQKLEALAAHFEKRGHDSTLKSSSDCWNTAANDTRAVLAALRGAR